MIREYLGRVSVAATKVLPKGDRLLFVGRTRAAIEAKVGPLASADADAVANALTSLGDPDELANRERERLYSARRRGAAAAPPALWKPSKESRRGAGGSRKGTGESTRGAALPPARQPGPAQGRRRTRGWPHRGLTGPDEPQPADTPQPAEPAQPAEQEQPAETASPPEPVPAVPRPADPPDAASPPADVPPPPALSPPPRVSPGEVPRPRVPPEQALEEGWPTEPAPAEPASGDSASGDSASAEPARTETAAAAGLPVPDLAGLEAEVPEPGAPGADEPEPGVSGSGGPEPGVSGSGGPEPGVPGSGGPEPGVPGSGGPEHNGTPPGWLYPGGPAPAPVETTPLSIVPGMSESDEPEDHPVSGRRSPGGWRSPAVAPFAEAWALARKHPLEAVAVVLLGVGGLILPFPFWLIGGLVALRSRRWDARDKWVALAGPPLVAFVVLVIRAVTSTGNFFSAFYHAAGHDLGLGIRAGCVLCAGYLIWRLRRGPRVRTLPPWQRPR
jgi:hypothetical protein